MNWYGFPEDTAKWKTAKVQKSTYGMLPPFI